MNQSSVLIVSDDTEFSRLVAARWQAERHAPEITLVTSDLWQAASSSSHDLVIVGPVRSGKSLAILSALESIPGSAIVYIPEEDQDAAQVRADHPHALVVPRQDGWIGTLILVSNEALRRAEAEDRAQKAVRLAFESQCDATLGRYMLEMRPSVNNALTSVLGNADLLLLEPGQFPAACREQIRTIHTMALRLKEIMQRFSSLSAEMRAGEKESQAETQGAAERVAAES